MTKIRAERRAGEILSEVERAKPGPEPRDKRRRGAQPTGYRETIKAADIPETTARRWQADEGVGALTRLGARGSAGGGGLAAPPVAVQPAPGI